MTKILGLDLGTNSIGWAVVEKHRGEDFHLLDKGVRIFQEGVKIEKGIESSKAAERTAHRSARRIKYRRKLRKIKVLKTLIKNDYCPEISNQELDNWRYHKIYPMNNAFLDWQKTNEEEDMNPYHFRALAVEQKLDLTDKLSRYQLGRAFYHISQRRGFLSNRLDLSKESDGLVNTEIEEISQAKGDHTLGQYFYDLYKKGEKIRDHYTHREKHYLAEFERICGFQELPEDFVKQLRNDIFYQRPLKSQKGLVGNCPFEKNKPRCPSSHPLFEEYRMYSFLNNIKIKLPEDDKLRVLNETEIGIILPLFYRKSKEHFNFEDIAKKLTPKGYKYYYFRSKDKSPESYLFNYDMRTSVSGCKTIAQLIGVFGDDWRTGIQNQYLLKQQKAGLKSVEEMINDIWHVLFSFDKNEKLYEFAKSRLEFDYDLAEKFSKIKLKQDYAALSLKAIKKIMPYLKKGLIYSHAVFLAKLEDLIPREIWDNEGNRILIKDEIHNIIKTQNKEKQLTDIVNGIVKIHRDENSSWSENEFWQDSLQKDVKKKLGVYYGKSYWDQKSGNEQSLIISDVIDRIKKQMNSHLGQGEFVKTKRIDERIKEFISDNFNINEELLANMYHPSAVEVYSSIDKAEDGNYYLGSPLIPSIKNPMAMRALHQVRKVINELIRTGVIDRDTKVNIEMARDLKNANERIALQRWQRIREKELEKYKDQLKKDIKASIGREIEPGEVDILKYQLWEEQNHICLYTGETIGVSEFVGDNPKYDIEHTIPRSLSFDNSQTNLTLCNREYNRKIKRNKIPSELHNHSEIMQHIEHWRKHIEEAKEGIQKAVRQSRANSDNKDEKDKAIQRRHFHQFNLDYWREKYRRFEMKDVPEGFKNSQLVDTGIITKYARLYLKTVFNNVYTVKGKTVSDFRKIWGIQSEYQKKDRINHIHHCIDAITIACMTKDVYEELAKAYHDWEGLHLMNTYEMPQVTKPWPTFSEDIKEVEKEVLVSHFTSNNLPKQSKKRLKNRGKIQLNSKGEVIYEQGDTVRGSLHQQTSYGAIKKKISNKEGELEEKLLYVVRKPIDILSASDIKHIVDDNIRVIIENGKKEEERLKTELEIRERKLKDTETTIEKTKLSSDISEIKSQLLNLFYIENKDGSFTPIKKVRCIATTVTNPLDIKKNRDLSKHDYKHFSHFANDGNYMMAIYEGQDTKGKLKRDFILVNNLDAGKFFTGKIHDNPIPDVHPKSGFHYKSLLKTGTMVILWKDEPSEIWELSKNELIKRLYKVIKMNKDGRITLKFNQEARIDESLKKDYERINGVKAPKSLTNGESYVNFEISFPKLLLSPTKFNFLTEHVDFIINPVGEFIRN